MSNERPIQSFFLLGIFAFLFALMVGILSPFFSVILWSTLLYIVVNPLHKKCTTRLNPAKRAYNFKRHLLAGVFSVGVFLLIIGPLTVIAVLLVQQGLTLLKEIEVFIKENTNFITNSDFGKWIINVIHQISPEFVMPDTKSFYLDILNLVQQYSSTIIETSTSFLSGTGSFMLSLLFVLFMLFFLFLDGAYLGSLVAKAIPIAPDKMKTLMKKFSDITKHLFSGYLLIALYQGVMAFILMLIFGVPGYLLLSVALMLVSFIPIGGTALVWVPVGIFIFFSMSAWQGILFLILAAILISSMDNFLRPLILQSTIQIHTLIIFFAILGGIQFFGVNGLLLGPITVILFFTVLDMITEKRSPDLPE